MTCKDCVYSPICKVYADFGVTDVPYNEDDTCEMFKSKSDLVEVVRCKECLYKNEWANDGTYPDYNFCKHSGLWHLTDNHFCSYGKRKEGAEE